jgi:hypothetical protein
MTIKLYDKVHTNFNPNVEAEVISILANEVLFLVYYPNSEVGHDFWTDYKETTEYIKATYPTYNENWGSYWVTPNQITNVLADKDGIATSPVCRKIQQMDQRRKEQGYAF